MEKDEENNFKKLIQSAGADKPPTDFTSMVMKKAQESVEKQFETEHLLIKILKENGVEKPSASFNKRILASVQPYESKKEIPLISRKAWYISAASFAGILLLAGLLPGNSRESSTFLSGIYNLIAGFAPKSASIPTILPLSLVATSVLFLLDTGIRQRFLNRTTGI